jgi:hypothetical protein
MTATSTPRPIEACWLKLFEVWRQAELAVGGRVV